MLAHTPSRLLACAALAASLAACGGHQGSSLPPGPPGLTPAANSNALTTYSVFVGQSNGESIVDVVPFGQTSSLAGAVVASNAYVVYPDGSQQQVDALGNFDASQSAWTQANINAMIANPSSEPVVDVYANVAGSAPNPEELAVNAYAPGGTLVAADDMRSVQGTAGGPELSSISIVPVSTSLADGRTKTFLAVGQNSDGQLIQLNKSIIAWSVTRANNCGVPAGTVKPTSTDPSKALYSAPATGTVQGNCADRVTATLTAGSATHSASASAFFFDPKTGAKLAGVLKDASGKAVPNALISLYGGGPESANGNLLVSTDANGKFSRIVPSTRILYPIAAIKGTGKLSFQQITSSPINPANVGAALANQTWTLGAPVVIVTPKPLPPFAKLVLDASYYGNAAREKFPFGTPNANGQFTAGTIEAILSAPKANATGSVAAGPYAGFAYKWDAAGKVATFTQSGPAAQAHVLIVTINAPSVNGAACPSGAACFSYTLNGGSTLVREGAWSQKMNAGAFQVTYVAGQHNATNQVPGAPIYTDVITLSQQLGSQNVSFTDQRSNAAGKPLGSQTVNRASAALPQLYTYTSSAKALSYRGDGNTLEVDYSLSAGVANNDGSGAYNFAVSASPVRSDIGDSVAWNINSPAQAASTGYLVTGTIDSPAFTGLASGHAASFTVDLKGVVTVVEDATLGGGKINFHI